MRTQPRTLLRLNLTAAAALACLALHSPPSHALALGQARVLSGLGEPLVAEIDVPQITPEEFAGLKARVGSPAEFEAAGMAFHPSLQGVAFSLQRRADGRAFLRLTGARPVNDPSIELILQAQGASRPVWRDYTLRVGPAAGRAADNGPPIAFGQARVLSARGEPLRAEIDLPLLSQGPAASVRAGVASAAEFQAAGMAYNTSLSDIQFSFQRRPDGRPFLSLTSDKPVNEPSLDLLLQANWSSGRIVRDYTLPLAAPVAAVAPSLPATTPMPIVAPARSAAGAVGPQPGPSMGPVTGVASRSAAQPEAAAATPPPAPVVAVAPVLPPAAAPEPAVIAPPPAPAPASAAPAAPPVAVVAAAAPQPQSSPPDVAPSVPVRQVKVRAGDTASRIALANKPAEISLDQMLVALLRANPDAFMGANVNRLKAGAVLRIPTQEQAAAVQPEESIEVLSLQSRNFDEYRRKLAAHLAPQEVATSRQAMGKLEARVTDKKQARPPRHRLTLSDGAVGSIGAERIIAARLARQAEQRTARLADELKALSLLQDPAAPAASASATPTPAGAASAAGSTALGSQGR